jgi:preprotein translocase subunit SecF
MLRILHDTKFDFIKWWRWAAAITIAFILLGLASFVIKGPPNLSIEFTGGTYVQVKFKQAPDPAELRATLDAAGVRNPEIQQFGDPTEYSIRARPVGSVESQSDSSTMVGREVRNALTRKYGEGAFQLGDTQTVGPKVGSELRRGAIIAMILASMVTLVYLAIRFEWRFGVAAVLSTMHDVLVTVSFIKVTHLEVSLTVVAAILTLLGYSGNDTIIIFDRVRENLKKARKEPLYDTLNRSINETLPRSVLTHSTVLVATLSLLFFAGEVLRPFAIVMTFGVFVATFSSIYVASPVLLYIERRFPRKDADKSQVSARAARAESQAENRARSPRNPKEPAAR